MLSGAQIFVRRAGIERLRNGESMVALCEEFDLTPGGVESGMRSLPPAVRESFAAAKRGPKRRRRRQQPGGSLTKTAGAYDHDRRAREALRLRAAGLTYKAIAAKLAAGDGSRPLSGERIRQIINRSRDLGVEGPP